MNENKQPNWLDVVSALAPIIFWGYITVTICSMFNSCTTSTSDKVKEVVRHVEVESCDCDKCREVEEQ